MANISQVKDLCAGCGGCSAACPASSIKLAQNAEGFWSPEIDGAKCTDCGVCLEVCPVNNKNEKRKPLACYAAKNPDEQKRLASSSGGVFYMLAERTVQNGGVVFGAVFNSEWDVVHDWADTIEGIAKFRGSKYVQSFVPGEIYIKCKNFLEAGRDVLFSGVPCQIYALKQFLGKDYENLLTVDLICHGVPSPGVWKKYLQEFIESMPAIARQEAS